MQPRITTLALAALSFTPSFAQEATVLVAEGDVLANGWTALAIGDHDIADDGRWAAIVLTTEPGADMNEVLMIDGVIAAAEGSPLAGETIAFLGGLSMDPGGMLAVEYTVVNPNGTTDTLARLRLGGNLVLSEDDPVSIPGVAVGSTINQILDVSLELPQLLVTMELRDPSNATTRVLVSYDVTGTSIGSPQLLAEADTLVGGIAGPVDIIYNGFEAGSPGNYMAPVRFDVGGTGDYAVLRHGNSYMEDGQPGILVNSVWDNGSPPDVDCRGGWTAAGGQIEISNGELKGIVLGPFGRVRQEDEGLAGSIIDDFLYCDVAVTASGDVVYAVPLIDGEDCLAIENDPILVSGASTASGRDITAISHNVRNVVRVSGDGLLLTCRVTLEGGDAALVFIDRDITNDEICMTNPNSTGVPGELMAIGSRNVALNEVVAVASNLPQNAFGYLITSTTASFVANPGGSAGNLCLGGSIGRYVPQVQSSGSSGSITTFVDLTSMPQPTTTLAVQPGERWGFQLWHRDSSGGTATSNFTRLISISFE